MLYYTLLYYTKPPTPYFRGPYFKPEPTKKEETTVVEALVGPSKEPHSHCFRPLYQAKWQLPVHRQIITDILWVVRDQRPEG